MCFVSVLYARGFPCKRWLWFPDNLTRNLAYVTGVCCDWLQLYRWFWSDDSNITPWNILLSEGAKLRSFVVYFSVWRPLSSYSISATYGRQSSMCQMRSRMEICQGSVFLKRYWSVFKITSKQTGREEKPKLSDAMDSIVYLIVLKSEEAKCLV